MISKTNFSTAINDVINNIAIEKKQDTVDMTAFADSCIKQLVSMDLPFYSVKTDDIDENRINLELPFVTTCKIQIEHSEFGSSDKYAILYVNKKAVRKVKLEEKTPEYMTKIAYGLLDYLNRYAMLKNKFV